MNPESPIQYTHTVPPEPGHTLEVAPGVHWLRMPLPFALDHINLWLLEDAGHWLIVDCGLGTEATRALWDQVIATRLAMGGVSRVFVTHHHPDHSGNAGMLTRRFGAPLLIPQAEFLTVHAVIEGYAGHDRESLAVMYRDNGMDEASVQALRPGGERFRRNVPDFPRSYRRVCEGDTLHIGANDWRVIMGYGHAPEHATLYCESLGVLIAGDMVLPRISTNVSVPSSQPDGNPLGLFLGSLARFEALPAETLVLPSHGMPFRGVRGRMAQLREHHRLRLAELAEACDAPRTAAEVIGTLFRRKLDNQQLYFAMGEAMAHLHYLHAEGLLKQLVKDGLIRYARA